MIKRCFHLFLLHVCACALLVRTTGAAVAPQQNCTADASTYWQQAVRDSSAPPATKTALYNITAWYGRLGNNVMQVRHALKAAICCNARLEVAPLKDLPRLKRFLDFSRGYESLRDANWTAGCPAAGLTGGEAFFYSGANLPKTSCAYDEYALLEFVLFDNHYPHGCAFAGSHCAAAGLGDDDLVVHIRSGDIFRASRDVNFMYRQPPVAFYETVFRAGNWSRILLVSSVETAEESNPVWTHYLNHSHWPQNAILSFQMSTSLREDLRTLWCARYFVAAYSTLSTMIIQTAPYLREYYTVEYCDSVDKAAQCHRYKLLGYEFGAAGNWSNSAEQRAQMIAYDGNLVDAVS